jgi:hypothetical protein
MTPQEALNYLTTTIAINYKPRRMAWEHDQDSPQVRQATLKTWVQLCTGYPTNIVHEAFNQLMAHNPTQPPTRAELANHLRTIHQRNQPARTAIGPAERCDPKLGYTLALEAFEQEQRRQGKEPNYDFFNRTMHGIVR